MQKYYTPEEVAEELRVTRRSVYEWLKTGRLRGLRAGNRWRIRTEDLTAFTQPESSAAPTVSAEERAKRVWAGLGSMAHVPVTVDEYLQSKREESEVEDRRWARLTGGEAEAPSR
jgi:excisionase family DNA binding protein